MEDILIIDDSPDIRTQLKWGLSDDYKVHLAADSGQGVALFGKHKPKAVILDLGLPPAENNPDEGFRCLTEILRAAPLTKVIIATGQGDREIAMAAVQLGAYDFLQKPIDLKELKVIIRRACHLYNLEEENSRLHTAMGRSMTKLSGIFGQCQSMVNVFSTIEKVATTDVPILVTGESGTGKELVARAIHSLSLRKDGPFIPINCGAIPDNLLESELFGHEKGAFTGANAKVLGKVEYAHNGTLFLDEIGELSATLQVKLLRFLQEKTLQRVGGRENIEVNARIVAATNIDIKKAIKEGRFREDLYYRIGVITIELPPLRERGTDIQLLSNVFLRRFCNDFSKKIKGFSAASVELLKSYDWPGNVRELENKIQRAVIMAESAWLEPHDLGFADAAGVQGAENTATLKEARDRAERDLLVAVLNRYDANLTKISQVLDISRPTLYDLLKKHNLSVKG